MKANIDTKGLNEASSASFSLSGACTMWLSSDLQMKLIINVALKLKSVPKYWGEHLQRLLLFFSQKSTNTFFGEKKWGKQAAAWNETSQIGLLHHFICISTYSSGHGPLFSIPDGAVKPGWQPLQLYNGRFSVLTASVKKEKEMLDEAGELPTLRVYQQSGESHRFTHSWVGERWRYGRATHSCQMA